MTTEPFRHQIQLAAPPDTVFPYLTRSELMPTWMGDYAALDPRPGGQFTVDINGIPVRGRFLEVDPPRRLVLTWGHAGSGSLPPGSTTVEITLTPTGTGTLLTVEHRDLPPEQVGQHAIGWPHFLARLAIAATEGNPGPDPFATQPPDRPAESRQESTTNEPLST